MAWTDERKLSHLFTLPWTIEPEVTPEGDRLLRVRELPAAVGHGETDEELVRDFWESFRATLACYLHFGDRIPLPEGVKALPWERAPAEPESQTVIVQSPEEERPAPRNAETAAGAEWPNPKESKDLVAA